MASSKANPNAKAALDKMKYEVATEVGVKKLFYFASKYEVFFYTHIARS